VLIELRERSPDGDDDDEDDEDDEDDAGAADDDDENRDGGDPPADADEDGFVARLYATRAQVRAMAARAVEAVSSGRPKCPLCEQPMDPQGHRCPRWN
jgi:uncharacterized repeat protein (TIGR03847 family)